MSDEIEKTIISSEISTADADLESQSALQAQIEELQKKQREQAAVAQRKESEEAKVAMPLANIRLKLDKNGSDVALKNITPAELLFLVAEHHANAGGAPITQITPTGKSVMRDPQYERARLRAKYSVTKIDKLFPGTEPVFPKTFSRALGMGINLDLGGERFVTFSVSEKETIGA